MSQSNRHIGSLRACTHGIIMLLRKEGDWMQKAVLAGVWEEGNTDFERQMEELKGLTEACEISVVAVETQRLTKRMQSTYVGSGRLLEIKERMEECEADVLVLLHECTPAQLRNIERVLTYPIMDRSELILRIFERRAKTKEAKMQVEMALCQYELPRLAHSSTHFSRQGGGRNKGKGEQQLALDKRVLTRRIKTLERSLHHLQEKKETQRRGREKSSLKNIALVGYTNAGKSTLLNQLVSRSAQEEEKQVFAQDMLFATLDTSVRLIRAKGHHAFLLSDTVGFLEDLPASLLEAFDATLKEAQGADLLLHVIDFSDPDFAAKREATLQTLQRIGCADIPVLELYNKVDLCTEYQEERKDNALYFSALSDDGINELLCMLDIFLQKDHKCGAWLFPYACQKELSAFYAFALVEERIEKDEGIYLRGQIPTQRRRQFQCYECEEAS